MTAPTQLPIPSNNLLDSRFNFEKLDQIVNSDADFYLDRFGKQRLTITGFQSLVSGMRADLEENILQADGYRYIGHVQSFEALRTIQPLVDGQHILLNGWEEGDTSGGGEFIGYLSSGIDDGGIIAAGPGYHWRRVLSEGEVRVSMYNPSSVTDHTDILQKAINASASGRVIIDSMLNITRVTLKDGTDLDFKGVDAGIISTGTTSPLYAYGAKNIRITNGYFKRNGTNTNAIIMTQCHNVTLENNITDGLCLLYTGEPAYTYSSITTQSDLSSNFIISNNRIDGTYTDTTGTVSHSNGVNLRWITDVAVSGNTVLNTRHGILWWGGDSNLSKDGIATNTRWAQRITINSNVVNGCEMGGIWGSMGIDIVVVGNTVGNCYDVGIDFEGCVDSLAVGNSVKNCSYGCLTTFFYTKNIVFSDNVCVLDGVWTLRGDTRIAKQLTNHLNGASSPIDKSDVTFRGNKFCYLGTETTAMGVVGATPLESLVYENNEFLNVRMSFAETTQNGGRIIIGNRLIFTKVLDAAFTAIDCASNTGAGTPLVLQVERNIVYSTSAQLAGSIGVSSTQDYYNGVLQNTISDNTVVGFPISISVSDKNTNSGISHFWNIFNNTVSGTIINNSPVTYPRKGSWFLKNNFTPLGVPVPSATPTSGRWIRNQRIELLAVSGGYLESVCTTAGRLTTTAWAASTVFAVDTVIYSGAYVYRCTVSGTTGTVAPTHTSGSVVDGTATWLFIDTLAVFKNTGAIT